MHIYYFPLDLHYHFSNSSSPCAQLPVSVCDLQYISNIFSSKLESLLNSSPESHSRNSLYSSINTSITSSELSSIFISEEIVRDALSQLKPGKRDGKNTMSNHFIYVKEVLSKLFLAMLRHGIVPDSFCDCNL